MLKYKGFTAKNIKMAVTPEVDVVWNFSDFSEELTSFVGEECKLRISQ
jgi:hypothetical protein